MRRRVAEEQRVDERKGELSQLFRRRAARIHALVADASFSNFEPDSATGADDDRVHVLSGPALLSRRRLRRRLYRACPHHSIPGIEVPDDRALCGKVAMMPAHVSADGITRMQGRSCCFSIAMAAR